MCVKGDNPNDGWTAFDNVIIGSFTIFQIMTLEGWTDLMYAAQGAESNYASWYFVVVVLIFGFIVVNLYIAVIVQTFAIIRRKNDARDQQIKEIREREAAFWLRKSGPKKQP